MAAHEEHGVVAGWTDTNGAGNVNYFDDNPAVLAYNEAHVEAVEEDTDTVTLSNQTGCKIDHVTGAREETYKNGGGKFSISVDVAPPTAGEVCRFGASMNSVAGAHPITCATHDGGKV